MEPFKTILDALVSIKTASLLLLAQVVLFLCGAFLMPSMGAYSSLNDIALLEWMVKAPASASWWLWVSLAVLALLGLNTVFCSVYAVLRKRQGRGWLPVVSPQIIHFGFCLLLLAHLMDASGGFRAQAVAREGVPLQLSGGERFELKNIGATQVTGGYIIDFKADAVFTDSSGRTINEKEIAPNRPAFHRGAGFYIKQVRGNAALIEVTKEPGAPLALAGGILFTLGTVALVGLKVRRER